jgi:hypothetical protein
MTTTVDDELGPALPEDLPEDYAMRYGYTDPAEIQDSSDPLNALSMARAASDTPNDPGPSYAEEVKTNLFGRPYREKEPPPVLTLKQKKDIEGKVAFWLEFLSTPLVPLDPVCIPVMQKEIPNIARKATPIICQSPEVVRWLTRAGNFSLWADLIQACMPVIKMIVAHHVMKTVGHSQVTNGQAPVQNFDTVYPVA